MEQLVPQATKSALSRLNLDIIHAPIAHARAVQPVVEELLPRTAGVSLQLALKISDAKNAKVIAGIDDPHEVEKRRFVQVILDDADDAAATVVTHAEQVGEMRIARHVLYSRAGFAPANRSVHTIVAIGASLNVGQPFQGPGVR